MHVVSVFVMKVMQERPVTVQRQTKPVSAVMDW